MSDNYFKKTKRGVLSTASLLHLWLVRDFTITVIRRGALSAVCPSSSLSEDAKTRSATEASCEKTAGLLTSSWPARLQRGRAVRGRQREERKSLQGRAEDTEEGLRRILAGSDHSVQFISSGRTLGAAHLMAYI